MKSLSKNNNYSSEKLFSKDINNNYSSILDLSDAILLSNNKPRENATIDIMQPSPPSRTGYQIPKKSSGNSTFASTKTVTSQEGETFNLKPKYKITDQY